LDFVVNFIEDSAVNQEMQSTKYKAQSTKYKGTKLKVQDGQLYYGPL